MGHHHHHGHHHHGHHHHSHEDLDDQAIGRIRIAFFLNFTFTIIEIIGGIYTQSLAIVADAVHDLGDSFALGLALLLQKKAKAAPSREGTYGHKRLSLLSALICSIILIVGSILVIYESVPSLMAQTSSPHTTGMLFLAMLGVTVNGWAAFRLSSGNTQNEKVLTLHLLEDLLGWVAVLVGAIIIHFTGWSWIDPFLAVAISCYILFNVFKSLRGTLRIFLQYIPDTVDLEELKKSILSTKGVIDLRHYHAWSLDGQEHVFTCQIQLDESENGRMVKNQVRQILSESGFRHITIEASGPDDDSHCHP